MKEDVQANDGTKTMINEQTVRCADDGLTERCAIRTEGLLDRSMIDGQADG